ncbi:Uncharacterised protein [Bacteroides xylanisolvens]|nr:Uncharacterised protein [Bacteroides xylanisolvens]
MLRLLIDLIRHARCRRAISRRINECIRRIETHLFQKRERLLMHLFRFSREAGDEIGRQHDVRHLFTDVGNKLLEMLDRISAIHFLQHFIRSMLHRQMHMTRHLRRIRHRIHHIECHISRMRRHIAHALDAIHLVDRADQRPKVRPVSEIKTIRIHILPEERHLLIAFFREALYLARDILHAAGQLTAAYIRHDAVRAELVAPLHDRDPCKDMGLTHRTKLAVVTHAVRIPLRLHHMAAARILLRNDLLQIMDMVRPDDEINDRHTLDELALILLCHAAGNPQKQMRIFILQLLDLPDLAIDLLLRILTDAAGIHDDDICLFHRLCRRISQLLQLPVDALRVRFIHLATVCD